MTGGSRQRARGLLIKALYQWQLAGHTKEELLEQYAELAEFGRVDQSYFEDLLGRVLDEAENLDGVIAAHADRGLDQLDAVARSILLLAMTELKRRDDVPVRVVIDEAIKLAKRYGATDSYRFVNAVLDKASKTLRTSAEVAAG
jgi:N utilization substance protein B